MAHNRLGTLGVVVALVATALVGLGAPGSAAGTTAGTTAGTRAGGRRTLPAHVSLDPSVRQLVTVTSRHWSDTRARLRTWRRTQHGWRRVRGPVPVNLGWNGWKAAQKRRQSTGTTPAGNFSLRYAFGNRPDPGTSLRYRHVDGNDVWPYEPRDPATYNVYQRHRARGTHWRSDYSEQLAHYHRAYAYAVVVGFNLPGGVHYSHRRRQWVARRPADTRRGGGIFLHVRTERYTAGCVAAPMRQVRAVVRWLDPGRHPRILMGPRHWLARRF